MNNINLVVIGSDTFFNILKELELNYTVSKNSNFNHVESDHYIKILFADSIKPEEVQKNLSENLPSILFFKNTDYLKKNKLILSNFHVPLILPIEIISLVEIINILKIKYNFFKKSKIVIKNYEIDSNTKIISYNGVKTKLTEKELELIFALNKNNGLKKSFLLSNIWKHNSDLDSHAFETNLHRLRKKIYDTFKDKDFIIEKDSLYFLKN